MIELIINTVLMNNIISRYKLAFNVINYLLIILGGYKRSYGLHEKPNIMLFSWGILGFVMHVMVYMYVSDLYNLNKLSVRNLIMENEIVKAHKNDIEEIFSNLDQGIAVVEKDQLSLSNQVF